MKIHSMHPDPDDTRREAFIKATLHKMLEDEVIDAAHFVRAGEWLRTVWHEARNEDWGLHVEDGCGAESWGGDDADGDD